MLVIKDVEWREDLLGLETFEFFLLLADGGFKVQISAIIAIFIQLERRIIKLYNK